MACRKIDAAGKSGDPNAQATAALEGLGTLLGGGKHIEPIGIYQLKRFVPETFAGLPKKTSNAEKTGIASLMISKAAIAPGEPSWPLFSPLVSPAQTSSPRNLRV
jgi:hypothetical protein